MNTDMQDAVSSVAEVAIFAWSLLELLLTRILPLVGFLTGHVLLHFCSLLSSVVTTSAASRHRRLQSSEYTYYSWEPQWESQLPAVDEEDVDEGEGDNVLVLKADEHSWNVPQAELKFVEEAAEEKKEFVQEAADEKKEVPPVKDDEDEHRKSSAEMLKSSDGEHGGIVRRISEEKALLSMPSIAEEQKEIEVAATAAEASPPKFAAPPVTTTDLGTEKLVNSSSSMNVAESSPSNLQKPDPRPSDASETQVDEAAADVAEKHVSVEKEVRAGKIDLKPSDTETRSRRMSGEGAEMRRISSKSSSTRGSGSILRVLPASLSQVERTLRQRSRRVSFSHPRA